ncbi:AAA family ATPase [Streptomyces sp. XM4193]|uniref:HelD family protein n=1 Tax=Streptomyces sp. XM4193 TaxID=2929782 RepID=UPI001FFAEEDE|nr:UvrD-helicase domain-containing protein [Streptomyces sp. XM4193]MCK1798465.1 AAA family ATPase [Streptomyces sp. XM4193]
MPWTEQKGALALETQDAGVRDREIHREQIHLDTVYRRLEEKIGEAEFLRDDAVRGGQVGTPGSLAERDAQVFRAGAHLHRLNSEFEDFLFGRIDLLTGKDGRRGADGAYTSVEPAEGAVRPDNTADIAETLHIGRLGVLDAEYSPLVIDWRAPAAAPFYRATPVAPGRVVRRRVIRSKGRRVLGVEDDLLRPELTARLDGEELAVTGDGALMAALGQARTHSMRDIVASIQAEQDTVIRAPAASVTLVEGGPGTGKTAVALHRAAYLLYQDRRRYAGGILVVSPTPLLVSYTEGVLPSLGEEGQVAIRAVGSLVDGVEANAFDSPAVARIKGSARMVKVLRRAARGALARAARSAPPTLRVVAFGRRVELPEQELADIRQAVLGGTAPVNLLRPRARRLLLDALWAKAGGTRHYDDPELAAEAREAFDEDISEEDDFLDFLTAWWPEIGPLDVLTSMGDRDRLARWSRRLLQGREVRELAASFARLASAAQPEAPSEAEPEPPSGPGAGTSEWAQPELPSADSAAAPPPAASDSAASDSVARTAAGPVLPLSVHDIALWDELLGQLGVPAAPRRRREVDPLDQFTGLEEVTTAADRDPTRRDRSGRDREERERQNYAHVIVDEAQDLTPMQWRMVGRRGRQATWTVVGDAAQSSWSDPQEAAVARDEALGARLRSRFELTVNYRNPSEIADLAARVLALAMPGATPPRAVRSTGLVPRFVAVPPAEAAPAAPGEAAPAAAPGAAAPAEAALAAAVRVEAQRLLDEVEGTVGVVVAMSRRRQAAQWLAGLGERVVALGSLEAKGLEYDATLVLSPAEIADESPAGLRVLYVALTRATQRLTVVSGARDLPDAAGVPDLLRD